MRVLTTEQKTPAWHDARAGRITASRMDAVLAGEHTKARRGYVDALVLDLEGIARREDEDPPPWFTDGTYYESFAIGWYQWRKKVVVQEYGFCVHDEFDWLGCSPDGGIPDEPGGLECKFRKTLRSFKANTNKPPTRPVFAQMQTQMWVMDWQWIDYLNYWRDDELDIEQGHITRVPRDQAFIDTQLFEKTMFFWRDVLEAFKKRNGPRPFAISLAVAS